VSSIVDSVTLTWVESSNSIDILGWKSSSVVNGHFFGGSDCWGNSVVDNRCVVNNRCNNWYGMMDNWLNMMDNWSSMMDDWFNMMNNWCSMMMIMMMFMMMLMNIW